MFDLRARQIRLRGRESYVTQFQVWWVVPTFGIFTNLEDAIAQCDKVEMDPQSCCIPTTVAVGDDGAYEVLR